MNSLLPVAPAGAASAAIALSDDPVQQPDAQRSAGYVCQNIEDIRRPAGNEVLVDFIQHTIDTRYEQGGPDLRPAISMCPRPHGAQDQSPEYPEHKGMQELVHVGERRRGVRAGLTRQEEDNTGPGEGQQQ